ncbi:starch-binding domain-containing protein 1 [Microcaecilia unicolor]|uniref:Starch-binding domain-containing protein 1 n=1 Tax=Microcaecilia unicolor TaxID=1415580 RepID=A0A6P7WTF1_9AMPH|nr:starch-binding domain-containing protein 1 [Microcaecilia unicolor]
MAATGDAGGAGESPVQPPGSRGSLVTALNSMWSALVLGILAAIFAWFWFGGSGEKPPAAQEEEEREQEACEPRAGEEETATGYCLEDQMPVYEVKEQILEESASKGNLQNIPTVEEAGREHGVLDETCQRTVAESVNCLQGSESLRPGSLGLVTCDVTEAKGQGIAKESIKNLLFTCPDGQQEKGHLGQPLGRELADSWEQAVNHPAAVDGVCDSFTCKVNEEFEQHSSNLSSEEVAKSGLVEAEAKSPEGDGKIKQVAAISPMPQNIHVTFKVHYITQSDIQLIAVTGDHKNLGVWEAYIPLKCDKDGFWSDSIALPADTRVVWKFVMVENGKIKRWEECSNRSLETGHDDKEAHQWWGYL